MKRVLSGALAAFGLSATLFAGGCQNSMYEENAGLHHQNRQLQATLSDTRGELQARPTAAQLASLQGEVAARDAALAERDRMIADLQAKLNAPDVATGNPLEGMAGVTVGMTARGDLSLSVQGDVLFPSGSTKINKGAEATLARIADILKKDYGGKAIRVEGHTDTDPIVKTKNLYADNRELSLKRAYSVTKFLEGKGVSAGTIETVGHGEHKPKGTKKDSRRVEIVVVM